MKTVPVLMPQMGQSIAEGTVVKWHHGVGDTVKADDLLVEVESDKIAFEVGSPVSGVLTACLKTEGDVADIGSSIGLIEAEDDAAGIGSTIVAERTADVPEETVAACSPPAAAPEVQPRALDATLPEITRDWLSPSVARLALVNNVSLDEMRALRGTGTSGRVTCHDLRQYLAQRTARGKPLPGQPAIPDLDVLGNMGHVVPMTAVRRTIADHMVQSIHTSAHVTMVHAVDVTNAVALRERIKDDFLKQHGVKMTYTGMMIFLAGRILKRFPYINASVYGENILLRDEININCAVALQDESLVVPVIRHADVLSFSDLSKELDRVIRLARSKSLTREDVEGGTFTISNFGTFGSLFGTPIINQPQVAILGMGAVTRLPVSFEGSLQLRQFLFLSFSFDHRVIDGAMGGRFLNKMQDTVESLSEEQIAAELLDE